MKKKEVKALKQELIAAVKKVLTDNNATLTIKIEKAFKRSIKEIVKKSSNKNTAKAKPVVAEN